MFDEFDGGTFIFNLESYGKDRDVRFRSHLQVWLFFEVILFYGTIISYVIFLTISRVFRFRTLREIAGYGA